MESIIPMTAGLLLDMCGAFIIVKIIIKTPIQYLRIRNYYIQLFANEEKKGLEEFILDQRHDDISIMWDMIIENAQEGKWGFSFLSIGFFLILVASWIDYLK